MKKFLFSIFTLGIANLALAQSDIVKVKSIDVDPEANGIFIKTTKGNYPGIPLDSMDKKSIQTVKQAAKKKSCVKLTENASGVNATHIACPKVLKPIKNAY